MTAYAISIEGMHCDGCVRRVTAALKKVPGVELNIGSTLPDTVELHELDVPDVSYRYVVVDDRTVLVDPDTREIVQVID